MLCIKDWCALKASGGVVPGSSSIEEIQEQPSSYRQATNATGQQGYGPLCIWSSDLPSKSNCGGTFSDIGITNFYLGCWDQYAARSQVEAINHFPTTILLFRQSRRVQRFLVRVLYLRFVVTAELMQTAKTNNIATFGCWACDQGEGQPWPRMLEHRDTVLYFDGETSSYLPVFLRAVSSLVSTNEIGIWDAVWWFPQCQTVPSLRERSEPQVLPLLWQWKVLVS